MTNPDPLYSVEPIPAWVLFVFATVCAAMSGLGFYFFLLKPLPEREAFQVIEGALVVDSVKAGKELRFQVEGYERELFLTHPKERIPDLRGCLDFPQRLRVRVDPWERNAARSSVMELETFRLAEEAEVVFSFEERLAWEVMNNRLGGGIGLFFGAFALGILLIIRASRKHSVNRMPSSGAITQHMYVSLPKSLVVFVLCACMTALFTWGVTQYRTEPVLAVLSVPMGLLFVFATALLLPWLIPWRALLIVDEHGIVDGQLGFGRIPWDRIERLSIRMEAGVDYLCITVVDEAELLRRSSLAARFCGWTNRLVGYPSISVCLFPLAFSTKEIRSIVESHDQVVC